MAGVAPQAAVHDHAAVGRTGLEPGQLGVAHGLEDEAGQPDDPADDRHRGQPGRLDHTGHDGEARQHEDERLGQVDDPERVQVGMAASLVQQVTVTGILALAAAATAGEDGRSRRRR